MKLWIRKIFVILVAIITLGLYIPPLQINPNAESNEVDSSNADREEETLAPIIEVRQEDTAVSSIENNDYINELTEKAKEQAVTKLGPRIAQQVELDFMTDILPAIEETLEKILTDAGEEVYPYYQITERPAAGYGERIFNIYDERTKKDVVRFHVRRDNRPMEGYWFNFHYHMSKDGFQEHHEIGEIYWDKNTPPKWMS